jgi:S1-C subfamily serine protease
MKLYSRSHLVAAIAAGALGALALAFVFGLVILPGERAKVADTLGALTAGDTERTSLAETVESSKLPITPSLADSKVTAEFSAGERENIEVYERYNEAVVNITTEQLYYNWFSEAIPQEGDSGSGSIIDERGYVLTNKHVVKDAYKVYVGLAEAATKRRSSGPIPRTTSRSSNSIRPRVRNSP